VILVGVVLRLPALGTSILNEDEALYATAAAAMQEGEVPYRAGVESKPPGIFYLYRAAFAVVGRYQMKAVHALTIPWVLATGLCVFAIARRAAGRKGALWAMLLYFVYSTVQEPQVLATQCELLYSLPLSAAALLLLNAEDNARVAARLALGALAGALCALATLIKPTAGSLFGAALLWLVVARPLLAGRRLLARGVGQALAVALGFGGVWLGAAVYFTHLGVWDDLVYWAFRWTLLSYIPTGFSTFSWFGRFATAYGIWGAACISLLVLIGFGAVRCWRSRERQAQVGVPLLASLWGCAAFCGTLLGGRFYDHYFPAIIPPLAVLGGIGAAGLDWRRWTGRLLLVGIALPAAGCCFAAANFNAAMKIFDNPQPDYAEAAQYLREHTRPSDRVFVWGYFPPLYVAADRLAATRFVGCHYLTGYAVVGLGHALPHEIEDKLGLPGGFETLLRELEANRAEVIVDTSPANLHHWRNYPLERYPQLANYVEAHYRREAVVGGNVIYRRTSSP
jgi:hypothetical protein